MLVGSVPVFAVENIATATAFYRDNLGFAVSFEYGSPVYYVCLCRDDVALHLASAEKAKRDPGQSALCVFVKDVDAAFAELTGRGVEIPKPPENYDYGMREFEVKDPDGNRLFFGASTDKQD